MKKGAIILTIWFSVASLLWSQAETLPVSVRPVNQSTLAGVGKIILNDTYLSPLQYDGITFTLLHDRLNGSRYANARLLLQQQCKIQVATTKNPTSSASEYYGELDYRISGFYPLLQQSRFRLLAGGGWEASLGGIYNMRNSNNPGSLKASTNLNLSLMAFYSWRGITFRWQLGTPFIGLFFSPEYGHSYYEIFTLGNSRQTLHFASFHNQQALRNYFTVDLPIRNVTLRAGYLGDYYRTDQNQLVTRVLSHQFVLGLAFESLYFGGTRVRDNRWLESVYY
ncbi:MAG TPA: DUF3316 domain-containing protein [Bacteroidales bacterium]|jgi:hypothetical protein|nr:DUF3316 domain-containing protein [Bacteroidales bacterium]